MIRGPLAGSLACLVLLLAGCGGSGPRGPVVGEPAPDYAAPDLAGDTVRLSSMRGQVVLLNLWATWCAPCRAETPFLESLHERLADDGLRIVGISLDTRDAADQVAMFVDEFDVSYTILHDAAMKGMELYQILGLPATFLIDRDGTLRWMMYGPVSESNQGFMDAVSEALE